MPFTHVALSEMDSKEMEPEDEVNVSNIYCLIINYWWYHY